MTDTTTPAACAVCGFHATGIGLETPGRGAPRWLCVECSLIVDRVRDARRMDPYEIKARQGGMDAAGAFIEANGSDLAEYTEEQALMLCGAIWKGCADEMRRLIRNGDAPF